jgi:hypothetical protein
MQVRNQLGNYKTRQNNFREKYRTERELTNYKGARPYTRSISSNRKLRRPVLSGATGLGQRQRTVARHAYARSTGTMSVVGPLVCVAFASLAEGALAGANVLLSDSGARTKRLPKIGGNERYHRSL